MRSMKSLLKIPSKYRDKYEVAELLNSRSVEELQVEVGNEEVIHRLVRGSMDGQIGVLAATNKRVVFVSRGMVRKMLIDFPYSDLGAVTISHKLFTSTIYIRHGTDTLVFDKVTRRHAKRFVAFLNQQIPST